MFTNELLEVGKMFGSIVGVWFALVGWKLVPMGRIFGPRPAAPAATLPPRP